VPTADVAPNPLNKRAAGEDDEIGELAETIRAHGIIQPLVVCSTEAYLASFPEQRPSLSDSRWVVLIGNRRLLAARLASADEIDIIVNDDQAASMYEVMLIENGQRKNLSPLLEAEAIAEALGDGRLTQRELARRIGKSHVYITQRLTLLKLVPELRDLLEQGAITIEQARDFGALPDREQRAIAAAGKPYRRHGGNGVNTRPALRSIRVTSPATAAESIRQKFSDDELAELIRLLTGQVNPPDAAR
jgi:ParB family chromosome partitioning protein